MRLPEGPPEQAKKLRGELNLIPDRHREDALQEAWVGYLEAQQAGEPDPILYAIRAAKRYYMSEARHEEREIPFSQLDGDEAEQINSMF